MFHDFNWQFLKIFWNLKYCINFLLIYVFLPSVWLCIHIIFIISKYIYFLVRIMAMTFFSIPSFPPFAPRPSSLFSLISFFQFSNRRNYGRRNSGINWEQEEEESDGKNEKRRKRKQKGGEEDPRAMNHLGKREWGKWRNWRSGRWIETR